MKLSSDEARAVAFVLGLIGLAAVARFVARPGPGEPPPGAVLSADTLEERSQAQLARQRVLARPLGTDERIDVNAAAADELDRLPGVGAALAERIVAERERGGAFDSAADLHAVPGLGRALLARLEPHLAFGPGAGLPRRLPAPPAETSGGPARLDLPAGPQPSFHRSRGAARDSQSRRPAVPQSVSLNRATAAQLEALPGIGPALAARIVAKRDSLNGFRSLDDLVRVRGVGPVLLARLKPYLRP